jgi:hypothetical protein
MKHTLAFLCLLTAFRVSTFSAPGAIADLSKLTTAADGIVVGEVVTATATGSSANVMLLIRRVIKGDFRLNSAVEVIARDLDIDAGVSDTKGKYGVWFLKKSIAGWIVLPATIGRLPLQYSFISASPISPDLGVVTSPADALLGELVAALNVRSSGSSSEVFLVMGATGSLATSGLKWGEKLSNSQDAHERRTGISMLLRSSSAQAASKLVALAKEELNADTFNTIARSLCQYRALSASDTADVGRLSSRTYPSAIRRCAIYSLRAVHNEFSLPFLKASLDDENAEVRYDAIFGIAAFALKMPMQSDMPVFPPPNSDEEFLRHFPSYDEFLKNEPLYATYWRSWLARRN